MEYKTLELEISEHIAHVRLNRPDVLNALNMQLFGEIKHCFESFNNNPDVRSVVLSGNGRMFCAGLDLKETAQTLLFQSQGGDPGRERERVHYNVEWLQQCLSAIDNCRVPVIAAIQNGCLGGGVDIVAACDLRLASTDAYFSIQEINVAIVADIGTLQRIPHLLPLGIVKELAYTGRKLPASEGQQYGFVNRILPDNDSLLAAAMELAAEIASKSPLAMMGTKRIINYQRDHSIDDGLSYVLAWNTGLMQGEDLLRSFTAVLKKQQPKYENLQADDLAPEI